VDELPAAAPWIARNIFGLPLLTWTVRTPEQRAAPRARRPDDLRGVPAGNLIRDGHLELARPMHDLCSVGHLRDG
jgi:hypothetical protein